MPKASVRRWNVACAMALVVALSTPAKTASAQAPERDRVVEAITDAGRPIPDRLWTDAPRMRDRSSDVLRMDTFSRLAEAVSPAVVNIDVTVMANARVGATNEAVGQGSGFIIHADGYVVTNAHVVGRATAIRVTTADRNVYTARIVGLDEATDIALLQIITTPQNRPARGFPIAVLGDSSTAKPGEWVVAIGNPFGLHHSVTAGIVSAVGRRDISPDNRLKYVDFIQFDAAINFGNSGGPLLNVNGHVIGVNTALRSGNAIGFAVPIDMVRTLLPHLGKGRIERAWLGIDSVDLSAEAARARGVERRGARVIDVQRGSPAEDAGLQIDDLVLVFDGIAVEDAPKLRWYIASTPPDKVVTMTVLRDNARVDLQATVQAVPRESDPETETQATPTGPVSQGISVDVLDREGRERLELGNLEGVLVTYVARSTAAYLAGARIGDVVTHVNNVAVTTPLGFHEAVLKVRVGQPLQLRVRRGRVQIFLSFAAGAATP